MNLRLHREVTSPCELPASPLVPALSSVDMVIQRDRWAPSWSFTL